MWRWLHSLPRAVRQQFHSPGASAGICVEDLHENEPNKREVNEHRPWVYHCRYRHEKKSGNRGKKGQDPEFVDFWKLLHGKHSAFEAIGWSGAIALCVELTHYNSYGRFLKTDDDPSNSCLLRKLASSIRRLSGHSLCPVYRLQPGETTDDAAVSPESEVNDCDRFQQDRSTDVPVNAQFPDIDFSSLPESEQSFTQEKRYTFYVFQPSRNNRKTEQARTDQEPHVEKTHVKQKSKENVYESTSIPVLSVDEAFAEFEEVCRKYTGIGKGIMGNQAALRGNMKSAAALWDEATSLGHSKSYFNLALCHEQGKGVKQNLEEAIRLYKLAVKEGHPQAMYNLATMYIDALKSSQKDAKKAIRLMTSAADLGLVEAQKYLGVYYSDVDTENTEMAVHYMKMAADQLDAESQYFLGMFYEHGYGVDGNTCTAAYLYNKAAESGHDDAMYNLALFHLDGIGGLPQDKHCADRLLRKSAEFGNKLAKQKLEELDKLNTFVVTDEDSFHTLKQKSSTDLAYLLKLSTSVSTPCLSEFVRDSFRQVKDKLTYDPVSDAGTVSQIYTQLMVPRGMTLVASMSELSNVSEGSLDDDDSDSGVVFQIGNGFETLDDDVVFEYEDIDFEDENMPINLQSRHSASMPDMMMLTCM